MNEIPLTLFFSHPTGRTFSVVLETSLFGGADGLGYTWTAHPPEIAPYGAGLADGFATIASATNATGQELEAIDLLWVPRDQLLNWADGCDAEASAATIIHRARANRSSVAPHGHRVFARLLLPPSNTFKTFTPGAGGANLKIDGPLQILGAPSTGWDARAYSATGQKMTATESF